MGWQDDVREILEKSDWPPRPGAMVKVPWVKVAMLAAAGWIVAELLTRAEEGARTRSNRLATHR
jgi:hypothetical protein